MNYIKTDGSTNVVTWPYSVAQLRADSNVSFSAAPPTDVLAAFNVFEVQPAEKPTFDPITQNVTEAPPSLVNGVWTQQWAVEDASAKQIASRQRSAAINAEHDSAKLDPWIIAFLAMTPDEAANYVGANGTTVAKLNGIVAKLAYSVRVLIRREFER